MEVKGHVVAKPKGEEPFIGALLDVKDAEALVRPLGWKGVRRIPEDLCELVSPDVPRDCVGWPVSKGDRVRVTRESRLIPGRVDEWLGEVAGFEPDAVKVNTRKGNHVRLVRLSELEVLPKTDSMRERQAEEARITAHRAELRAAKAPGKVRRK